MTKEKLEALWRRFKKRHLKKDKNKLIEHYYGLVEKISNVMAKKINYKVASDELASHGVNGLFKAIEKFDLKRNIKFETFAYSRIRGSMIDGLRSDDWVPRGVRIRQSKIEKATEQLEAETGDRVDDISAAKRVGIDVLEYVKNPKKFSASVCSSLDTSSCLDDDDVKKDFNKHLKSKISSPDIKMIRREFLSKFLGKHLSPSERMFIYLYYYEKLTMKDIAKKLKKTEPHIGQMHKKILKDIKAKISKNQKYLKEFQEIFAYKDTIL